MLVRVKGPPALTFVTHSFSGASYYAHRKSSGQCSVWRRLNLTNRGSLHLTETASGQVAAFAALPILPPFDFSLTRTGSSRPCAPNAKCQGAVPPFVICTCYVQGED